MSKAEQGNTDGQKKLGDCYFIGDGVEQDHKKAVYWLKKSAKQGDSNAIKVLKDMGENCD